MNDKPKETCTCREAPFRMDPGGGLSSPEGIPEKIRDPQCPLHGDRAKKQADKK